VVIRDEMGTPNNVKPKSHGGGVTGDLQRKLSSDINIKKRSPSLGAETIPESGSVKPPHITRKLSNHDLLLPLASTAQSDLIPGTLTDDNTTISVLTSSCETTEQFSGLHGPGGASPTRLKTRLGSSARKIRGSLYNTDTKVLGGGGNDILAEGADSSPDLVEDSGSSRRSSSDKQPDLVSIGAAVSTESSSGVEKALSVPKQSNDASAKKHIGVVAADYLEKLTRELLQTDAPLLLEEIKASCEGSSSTLVQSKLITVWVDTLMTLATRCCTTVEPDVRNGDLLGK
jgi:hypothetical protein